MSVKQNWISIALKAFDPVVLDEFAKRIVTLAAQSRVECKGPIPLPTSKKIHTVNRSPHIDKESREQFICSTHKRIINVRATQEFIDRCRNAPTGVSLSIKLGGLK